MDISGSYMGAVESTFNLSGQRGSVFVNFRVLSREDQSQYLQTTASLLKQGIVGNETVQVNGRPLVTDATTRLGDPRLLHAPTWRGTANTLDVRA